MPNALLHQMAPFVNVKLVAQETLILVVKTLMNVHHLCQLILMALVVHPLFALTFSVHISVNVQLILPVIHILMDVLVHLNVTMMLDVLMILFAIFKLDNVLTLVQQHIVVLMLIVFLVDTKDIVSVKLVSLAIQMTKFMDANHVSIKRRLVALNPFTNEKRIKRVQES